MKLGLVLAGGGGKGAYQIGVLEALQELGIAQHIQVISGTSVGALNAMLFMQGDMERARNAWINLSQDKILPLDKKDIIMHGKLKLFGTPARISKVLDLKPDLLYEGACSREGITEVIDQFLDVNQVRISSMTGYCTCCDIKSNDKKYFRIQDYPAETIKNILLASCAIPGIYDAVDIDGMLYLDGGVKDNLPIFPVYNEGCDLIIVVRLGPDDIIEYQHFPNTQIIDIALQQQGGILKDGTLDFAKENIIHRMNDGYTATMNLISPIFTLLQNMLEVEKRQKYIRIADRFKLLFLKK